MNKPADLLQDDMRPLPESSHSLVGLWYKTCKINQNHPDKVTNELSLSSSNILLAECFGSLSFWKVWFSPKSSTQWGYVCSTQLSFYPAPLYIHALFVRSRKPEQSRASAMKHTWPHAFILLCKNKGKECMPGHKHIDSHLRVDRG